MKPDDYFKNINKIGAKFIARTKKDPNRQRRDRLKVDEIEKMHYCKTKLKATDNDISEAFDRDKRTVCKHLKEYSVQLSLEKAEKERTKQQPEIAEVVSTELILKIKELARKLSQELEHYDLVRMLLWGRIPTLNCTINPTNDDSRLSAEKKVLLEHLQPYRPLWDYVQRWDKDMPEFQDSCRQLHRQIRSVAEEKTELRVEDSLQEVRILESSKGKTRTEIEGLNLVGSGLSKDFIITICEDIFENVTTFPRAGTPQDLSYKVEKMEDLDILRLAGRFIAVASSEQLNRCQEVHKEMRESYRKSDLVKTIQNLFNQLQELKRKLIHELAKITVRGTFPDHNLSSSEPQ